MGLASEIQSHSALQLLTSHHAATSSIKTRLDSLDTLLERTGFLQQGDVVEVQGAAGSGKTELCLFLTMTSVLPESVGVLCGTKIVDVPLGGNGKTVVYYDLTTQRFPIARLAKLLYCHIATQVEYARGAQDPPSDSAIQSVVDESLANLYVFEPTSLLHLAISIKALPEWYLSLSKAPLLGYVIIDGLSTHLWSTLSLPPSSQSLPLKHLLQSLSSLISHLAPIVIITQWVPHDSPIPQQKKSSEGSFPFWPSQWPPPWPSIVSPPPPPPLTSSAGYPEIRYHITLHPPRRGMVQRGRRMEDVLRRRREGNENDRGAVGFMAVVRVRGGKEVGRWMWDIQEERISS